MHSNVLQLDIEFNFRLEQRISNLRIRFKQFQKFRMRKPQKVAEEKRWCGHSDQRTKEWDVRSDVDSW